MSNPALLSAILSRTFWNESFIAEISKKLRLQGVIANVIWFFPPPLWLWNRFYSIVTHAVYVKAPPSKHPKLWVQAQISTDLQEPEIKCSNSGFIWSDN